MKLKNKVAIITGSSSGIGASTAVQFAKEGAKVVVNYLSNSEGAEKIKNEIEKSGGEAILIQANISIEADAKRLIEETIKHFGTLDILINNAGKFNHQDCWNGSFDAWQETIANNLFSALNCSKFAGEYFLKNKKGVIVNIASRFGLVGDFEAITYGASKAGIINITKAYAKLLAPFGRANCISPGPVKTGYWATEEAQQLIPETIKDIPLGKLAEVEDIVNGILFFSCDDSKMITGQNLQIDGGFTLK